MKDRPISFDQLLYNCPPGIHVSEAVWVVMRHLFAGFVLNGIVVEREPGDDEAGVNLVAWYLVRTKAKHPQVPPPLSSREGYGVLKSYTLA